MVLPPNGRAPTAEDISLLENVDVRITREAGVALVGVPIGTEYIVSPFGSENVIPHLFEVIWTQNSRDASYG